MNLVERLREDAKAFANRFGADAEKLSIWEAADRLELLEAEITRLQKERDGIDEERRTALALVLERNAQIQALQKELETAREALERIVAPGTVSGMHAQDRAAKLQFIAWRALQDKEVAG